MRCVLLPILLCGLGASHVNADSWRTEILLESEHGMGGAAIGDLDPNAPGNGVAVVTDAPDVWLARRARHGWETERIYVGSGEFIMCAIGDVDLTIPGEEAYACRYSGKVTQFTRTTEDLWESRVIHADERPLHHLLAGEFDPLHDGVEWVTCGHGGHLIAIYPDSEASSGQAR